ncbi:MAG: biotin--[acetyl-CoA-carboxylase] ligase [Anaerovoracaceae bacterium]|jgi:BirA family biotin operon repressor/biotin-[acetyl-CoA-carboxylase] ligase
MEELIRKALKKDYRSVPIYTYEIVDSTNNVAKSMAKNGDVEHGTIIIAKSQSSGRGRRNRFFYSPSGLGLYLSLVLKRRVDPKDSLFLTIAASVAACRAIEKFTGKSPLIKWVNDLFLDGKKISGILTEGVQGSDGRIMDNIVVGIGINIHMDMESLPNELSGIVGALNVEIEPSLLGAEITNQLLDMEKDLKNPDILREYREKSLILGKDIVYLEGDEERRGKAVDINDQGNLIVEKTGGGFQILQSGEVSIIIRGEA